MDLAMYRHSAREQERIDNLMKLLPPNKDSVLDAGARDGYLSLRLAHTFKSVTALDLDQPQIQHARVACVVGDITNLQFPDKHFDVVLCAEVLEHIPLDVLAQACSELRRVARHRVVIGVPYKQDTRIARSTCHGCHGINPPWAHLSCFDEHRLAQLFSGMPIEAISFAGRHRERTNPLSTLLMDLAGNPYGTYVQEEPCVHCGEQLLAPTRRSFAQKVATKFAVKLNQAQSFLASERPVWIHMALAATP